MPFYPMTVQKSQQQIDWEFKEQRIHFAADGSITFEHGSISTPSEYYKVVQDFPTGTITRCRKYDASNTLLATKTTTVDASTGDIVDTIT